MRELTPGKEVFEQLWKGMRCSRSSGGSIITIENLGEAVLMLYAREVRLRRQPLTTYHVTVQSPPRGSGRTETFTELVRRRIHQSVACEHFHGVRPYNKRSQ